MEQSLYFEYVQRFFPQLITEMVEQMNEKRKGALTQLWRERLIPTFSADGRWASILAKYTRVAADVVALDSELPLMSRDKIETASGDLPKLGKKMYLTEKEMKNIDAMIAQNLPLNVVVQRIFEDTPKVIDAIIERIEDLFLSELSTGVGLSINNNGTGTRINMNYYAGNKFGVKVAWAGNAETCTPLDDLQKVFDKADADGNTITDMWVDDTWLNAFYQSKQVREQYAFNMSYAGGQAPRLNLEQAQNVVLARWGVTLHRVNRSIRTEINGVQNVHKPWANGVCAFTCDEMLGDLVWTTTAEATRPAKGVTYQTVEDFILVSKYSTVDPLREFTASQAMAVPVLNNVDRIYLSNSTQVQE